ncbi:MAG: hypothetical protein ACKPKO_40965, partial [Candidatus Fonsibacter sp.]
RNLTYLTEDIYVKATKETNIKSHVILCNKIDIINRQFMVRRLAAVKQRRCYIQIFKLIAEHNVPYTVNMKGASSSICRICPTSWCGR